MTKDLKTIDLNLLPIVTLGEMANEAAEQVEKNAKATVQKAIDCGRYLTAIKEQLEHGQWGGWLGANWNYSQQTASRYMTISANYSSMSNLKQAKDINDALRIIADSKPETAPRSARKPADVVVTTPSADLIVDATEKVDDDPAPDPPTQRKNAKGSEKVPEAAKPRTQQVPVEIIEADEPAAPFVSDPLEYMTFAEILAVAVGKLADETQQKKAAKELRKLADKLDPPDESPKPETVPTIAKLVKAIPDEVGALRNVIERWARHKQSLQGKARVRSMESWETMIEQMMKAADTHGVSEVSESIRSSIANGYTGWDIQLKSSNGKGNGNGHTATRNGGNRGLTAEDVFSAESLGRSR